RSATGDQAHLRLVTGLDVRLLLVSPDAYPLALHRATGSEAHVRKIAAVAGARGMRMEADGLYQSGRSLPIRREADLYRHLGLPKIPPELREDAGEVEAALGGTLPPDLVRTDDIRGLVHCHTVYSDGRNTIEEMARGAEARGMSYLTITDHSATAGYAHGLEP